MNGTEFGYALAFATGLAGLFHCLGMCGGFAAGYFAGHGWRRKLLPQLSYHAARLGMYALLGMAGAGIGRVLVQTGQVGKIQGIVMILAGLLIVLIGIRLSLAGWRRPSARQGNGIAVHFDRWKRGGLLPVAAGAINGFVPCSLLFSVSVKAVATANPLEAGLLMLCFGLGTLPAMVLATTLGAAAGEKCRGLLARLSGLVVVLFGAWTIYEGLFFYDIMRGLAN